MCEGSPHQDKTIPKHEFCEMHKEKLESFAILDRNNPTYLMKCTVLKLQKFLCFCKETVT